MNQESTIEPINVSSSKFGVLIENQIVVLDDAKHVIGVDSSHGRNLIIENIKNRKADKFRWRGDQLNNITTLVYDEDTGFLYTGDNFSNLFKYKLDKTSKTCERVKHFKDPRIGQIFSSHRFLRFVFFGGNWGRISVLDLSTGKLLPGHLETSMEWIYSLQVCVKSKDEIYLAVSGKYPEYCEDKTDLFDLTDLLIVDSMIHQKYLK